MVSRGRYGFVHFEECILFLAPIVFSVEKTTDIGVPKKRKQDIFLSCLLYRTFDLVDFRKYL